MSEIKHSGTPWAVENPFDFEWSIIKDNGAEAHSWTFIATTCFESEGRGDYVSRDEARANAEFICLAVNSHARRVAENARLREMLARLIRATDGFKGTARDEAGELLAELEASTADADTKEETS